MAMTREDMAPIELEIVELLHTKTETPHDALGVLAAVTLAIQEEEIRKYLDVLGYVKLSDLVTHWAMQPDRILSRQKKAP